MNVNIFARLLKYMFLSYNTVFTPLYIIIKTSTSLSKYNKFCINHVLVLIQIDNLALYLKFFITLKILSKITSEGAEKLMCNKTVRKTGI